MGFLQIFLIVLLVAIIAGVAILLILNQENRRKSRMLNIITGHADAGQAQQSHEDIQNKRRAEIAKKLKDNKEEESGGKKKKATLSLLIQQAGLTVTARQYWIYAVISAVACMLIAKFTGQGVFVVLMAGVIGLLGVPRFVLNHMAKKRQKKFLEEFADALEASVRLLKAGMPVSEAILMISREFTGPVGEEMSRIYDKQKIGIPLHEAATEACKRMPLTEMQMFATGLSIQAQTGSSLSEVLTNLAGVIRARFRLKRKIKALSSEAVASACIIGALPIVVALGMYFVNPDYIKILFDVPIGQVMLTGSVTLMLIGIFVMRAMINFKF